MAWVDQQLHSVRRYIGKMMVEGAWNAEFLVDKDSSLQGVGISRPRGWVGLLELMRCQLLDVLMLFIVNQSEKKDASATQYRFCLRIIQSIQLEDYSYSD